MSKIWALSVVVLLTTWAGNAAALNNLYVLQMGDGSSALTNAATPVLIQKFDPTTPGPTLGTIAMPVAASGANQPLTVTGNSGSEGHLSVSTDGNYLVLGGYGATPGTATPAQATAATISRVIGRVTVGTGAVDTSTALSDAYDGIAGGAAGFRSVASDNGNEFWLAGTRGFGAAAGSDGVRYATLGSTTSSSIENFPNGQSNIRIVDIIGGQLYMGTGSASHGTNNTGVLGINTIGTGLPTTSGQLASGKVDTTVSGSGTSSPYDFWFKDASTVYIADDRAGAALGGGIEKWESSDGGTTWTIDYTIATGATVGARGLTGAVVGENTVLYATTAENSANKLISVVDSGASSTFTTLATAPANTVYRGVALAAAAVAPGVSGDYNGNGVVDMADYVLWRNGGPLQNDPTPGVQPADYDFWRSRFAATSGSGAGLGSSAVPEPTGAVLLLMGLVAFGCKRR
jgi:hypothetical protein